jgi:DNA gyrase subunit A
LQRLTGLEHEKLLEEYRELLKKIEYLKSILANEAVLRGVIHDEIQELKDTYATPRKTVVEYDDLAGIDIEDLIPDEDVVITLSRRGYIKRTTLDNYQQQRRGGKGIAGLHMSEDDVVQDFLTTSNHQYLLLFTNRGRMHQLKAHQVPEGSRTAKGAHIANLLPLEKDEMITTVLTVREFSDDNYFLFVTKKGMVKRSEASLYARSRKSGLLAVSLREGDELITVREVQEHCQIVLTTEAGLAIRFSCNEVRPMGRGASGVKGIALRGVDSVVACVMIKDDDEESAIMTISRNGYGKRTKLDLYRVQSRGGKGVINFRATAKTGPVIGAMPVGDNDALILLTSTNKIIRIGVDEVRSIGRATQGVRLVTLDEGASVVGFDRIDDNGEQQGEEQ